MKAVLLLEDGTVFEGASIGTLDTVCGEVVFHTEMIGYQEVLTDPSCHGQILVMTYPLMGNWGINEADGESDKPQVKGLVVRELCDSPGIWRSRGKLGDYLKKYNIPGIQGIDTRELTRILRDKGTMKGLIVSKEQFRADNWLNTVREHQNTIPAEAVGTEKVIHRAGEGHRVALMDFGVRKSIVELLVKRDCDLYIFPAKAAPQEILAVNPAGIMLSNGPGNPKDDIKVVDRVRELFGKRPLFGTGLGHQLIALASGADTGRLKYGHRGGSHPVRDVEKGITCMTTQNHGYVVLKESLDKSGAEISHISVNDGSVEGLRYKDKPVFTVQFHPEVSPGPVKADYLIDEFMERIKAFRV